MPEKLTIEVDWESVMSPSISELKQFGSSFSREEWESLCLNKEFIFSLMERPLDETIKIADKIFNNS